MKTYDKLSKKNKDKLNTMVLCSLPYVIMLHGLLILYTMLMLAGVFLVCLSVVLTFQMFFYGLILIAGGMFIFVIMKMSTDKYKNRMKQYFGIKDEEELF